MHLDFESTSQAGQDAFVLSVLPRRDGTFLDIGSGHPLEISNTLGLERIGWRGLCIDIAKDVAELYATHRKSRFVQADAKTCDYVKLLKEAGLPRDIDYLSLDVDEASLDTLHNLPLDDIRFKVLTIEHDRYRFGQVVADRMRARLSSHGYQLIHKDVTSHNQPFEDWWIAP